MAFKLKPHPHRYAHSRPVYRNGSQKSERWLGAWRRDKMLFDFRCCRVMLPPESSSVEDVSREVGVSTTTLERWRVDALANASGDGSQRWTAAARLQAVIATAAMDEATCSVWCREQGIYPA